MEMNSKHLIFFILGLGVVSLKTYPGIYIRYGGRDTWIAVIIASILIIAYILFIIYVIQRTNKYDFSQVCEYSLGKKGSKIALTIYCMALIFVLIEGNTIQGNAMHNNMLLDTPPWFFVLCFSIATIYVLLKEKRSVVLLVVLGIVFIIAAGINLGILTARDKHFDYLLPILARGLNMNFFIAVIKSLSLYSFVFIFTQYLIYVRDRENIIKCTVIGLISLVQMIIVSAIGVITTFGVERSYTIVYPKLIQTQLVSYFGVIESGELFVMLQMMGGWFIKYIITFTALLEITKNINKRFIIWTLTPVITIISMIFARNTFEIILMLGYFSYISLFAFIIMPLGIYSIAFIKYKKTQKTKAEGTLNNR